MAPDIWASDVILHYGRGHFETTSFISLRKKQTQTWNDFLRVAEGFFSLLILYLIFFLNQLLRTRLRSSSVMQERRRRMMDCVEPPVEIPTATCRRKGSGDEVVAGRHTKKGLSQKKKTVNIKCWKTDFTPCRCNNRPPARADGENKTTRGSAYSFESNNVTRNVLNVTLSTVSVLWSQKTKKEQIK